VVQADALTAVAVVRFLRLAKFDGLIRFVQPDMLACLGEADRRHHRRVPRQTRLQVRRHQHRVIELHRHDSSWSELRAENRFTLFLNPL
jgi:hypothetical protein